MDAAPRIASGDAGKIMTPRNFSCNHPGCSKRFTRAEHLQRHALNHTAGNSTCPRCRAHFKRPDLLERHLSRHRQKDEEAGSAGSGVLNTRKRCWKAPDGKVVQKKPQTTIRPSHSPSSQDSAFTQAAIFTSPSNTTAAAPISPPTSAEHSDIATHQEFQEESYYGSGFAGNSWPISGIASFDNQAHVLSDENFWVDSGLLPTAVPSSLYQTEQSIDELFQPDTASSFNMPYTTAANYNWLFDQSAVLGNLSTTVSALTFRAPRSGSESLEVPVAQMVPGNLHSDQGGDIHRQNSRQSFHDTIMTSHTPTSHIPHTQRTPTNLTVSQSGSQTSPVVRPPLNHIVLPMNPSSISDVVERPLSTIRAPSNLPVITEDTRERLLQVIDSAQPSIPSGRLDTFDHPLLCLNALQNYSDLYFTRFNTSYPLIHCATFDPTQKETLLLLSVLLLGATYSTRDAHQLAVCIHDVIRPQIFAHAGFSAKPELWVLQTILLVECFGKSRAGQKQHDMSHLFHGLLINLIRRSDCQTIQTSPFTVQNPGRPQLDSQWQTWAEAEEKKRLAFLCFMWDTQHAVLFCQSLCMSAFELRLTMPCSQQMWEARDQAEWIVASASDRQPEISFLAALKSLLFTPSDQRPTQFNALSRILLLHGLMSISWDMERRDQTALGVVSFGGRDNWRHRLGDAYDLWKAEFDTYCVEVRQQLQAAYSSPSSLVGMGPSHDDMDAEAGDTAHREFATFVTAYNAVYHAAHIQLNSSFLDVQIYAGARHILGRPVHRTDYVRSEKVTKRWAAGTGAAGTGAAGSGGGGGGGGTNGEPAPLPESTGAPAASISSSSSLSSSSLPAVKAAFHAACMLHEASNDVADFDFMGLFHVPWCLYLATLTLWAFHHARPGRWGGGDDDGSEMVWDARKEMDELLSSMAAAESWTGLAAQGKRSTGALVWVMAEVLSKVRWGIIHSGVLVLRALIPLRLISQYEGS